MRIFGGLALALGTALAVASAGCGGSDGGSGSGGSAEAIPSTGGGSLTVLAAAKKGDDRRGWGPGGKKKPTDGGSTDGGSTDGGSTDGGSTDGGSTDGGSTDGGSTGGGSTGSTGDTTPAAFDVSAATLGTNLVAVSYYTPERPFVDVMRSSQVLDSGFPWHLSGGGTAPSVDAQGYPRGLASGQAATTYAMRGIAGRYPTGAYVVLFEGDGAVELSWDGGRASRSHGGVGTARFVANVSATSNNGFTIKITRSNASNHVRNVRVIMPGFEGSYATQPFHPLFLERIAPFAVLRFMDWGSTNNSTVSDWSQRKRPDYRSMHARGGVAYEVMADLCNRTGKHMWVCVPHKATDDYVRQLATLLRDRLDPSLKLFVEYSNEVWNASFRQYSEVNAVAKSRGLTSYAWYAQRSVQIFKTFEQVLGGRSRLVRVLGSQHGNPWVGKQILNATPAGAADVLAIAPYFGHRLGYEANAPTTRSWSVDKLLAECAVQAAAQRDLVRQNMANARAAGLKLVAYEGGQHLAGVGKAVDDTTLVNLFTAANRHAKMGQIYRDYLAMWKAEGGGTFVHFNDVFVPQKWGAWGALEYLDQAPSTAPKYSALVEVAAKWNPAPASGGGSTPTPTPDPTTPTPDPTTPTPTAFDVRTASIGTNLVEVTYYTPEWPFVDAMRSSRVNSSGFPWELSGGTAPALDAQGYPKGLASGQVAYTYTLRVARWPVGQWVVLFEGDGAVEMTWDGGRASLSHGGSGTARFVANVAKATHNGFTVRITRSSASNHVRNIRVIMPGFEGTYATQPFHPLFLQRIQHATVLRFMDWGSTNNSNIADWSQRKRPDYRSMHGRGGVAYEVMADLCNRTKKHMWVCVPHKATDDYVRQLATLLRDRLDPSLKLFVEYSNEVWNSGFRQYSEVNSVAQSKGLTWYAWYAQRSVQIFKTFEQVLGGRSRLVRVLGSQHGNPWVGKQILNATPAGAADVLAIAPYFGHRLGYEANAPTTRSWSVDKLLAECAVQAAAQRDLVRQNMANARTAGLTLVAYEGGQHLVGVGKAVDDTTLTNLFIAANRHAKMGQIYRDYLAMWKAEGGGTFVHFNDVFVPQKWGSWGALEHQDQAPSTAPKYSALVDTAAQWAQSP